MILCKDCEYSEKKAKADGSLVLLQRCLKNVPVANSGGNEASYPIVNLDNDGCFEGKAPAPKAPKNGNK